MATEITEENCKQALFDFMEQNYDFDYVDAQFKLYPYTKSRFDSIELLDKDRTEWFLLEWRNPKTKKTVLREFTEKTTMSPGMKEKMLQMENIQFGEFKILKNLGKSVRIKDDSGKRFVVELIGNSHQYVPGRFVIGRIHPWGKGYRFAGIVHVVANEDTMNAMAAKEALELLMNDMLKQEARKSKKPKSRSR